MKEQTFEWGGATFTVRPATIRMHMQKGRLQTAVSEAVPDADVTELFWYVRCCVQTTIDGDLNWQLPQNGAMGDELAQSFNDFYETLPESLFKLWFDALVSADDPYVSAEFQPFADLKELDPKD